MVKTEKNSLAAHYIHLFEYNNWATLKTAESVISFLKVEGRASDLLSHIISSQKVWLGRILENDRHTDPWQKHSLEACIKESGNLTSEWIKLLKEADEKKFETKVSYKNTKGESFTNTIKDIVTHVINHSTYHRAQIALLVRQAGGEPAKTDYIVYQRQR
jgi:uncharacterized damage-inducible protein DinB